MATIEEAQEILRSLGMPKNQQNKMSALTLLALAQIKPQDAWNAAQRLSLTLRKGIMTFVEQYYGETYAENTRETFRRQVLHQFVQARLADYNPDNPDLPTYSPHTHYALTTIALSTIQTFGTSGWEAAVQVFVASQGSLIAIYRHERTMQQIPIRLPDDTILSLSPGAHNVLQKMIVEEFAPRFAPGALLIYLGDTANKDISTWRQPFSSASACP